MYWRSMFLVSFHFQCSDKLNWKSFSNTWKRKGKGKLCVQGVKLSASKDIKKLQSCRKNPLCQSFDNLANRITSEEGMTRVKGSIIRKAKFKFLGSRKGENF